MSKPQNKSRRGLLLGLAGLSAVAWGWQSFVHRERALTFAPVAGLPGWRQAETAAVSGGSSTDAVFLGIGGDATTPLPADQLCDTLYAETGPGLPVAVFTDINCPNCRSLEAKLAARADRLNITWLHLPLLGRSSVTAAKITVAASLFGNARSAPPGATRGTGAASLVQFHARRTGVDPEFLNDEYEQQAVKDRLHHHARTAEALGIWGTPAMTIGKTLVMGDVPGETLNRLLEMEHPACG